MKLFKLLLLLPLSFAAVACGNDDDDRKNEATITVEANSNNIISRDLATGESQLLPGANYSLRCDFNASTLTLSVFDLQLRKGQNAISFQLPPLKIVNGTRGLKVSQTDPVTVSAGGSNISVDDIHIEFVSTVGGEALVLLNYQVDSRYNITTLFKINRFQGKTISFRPDDPTSSEFTSEETQYMININAEKMTADLAINKAKFQAEMPSLGVMTMKNIPFTLTVNGIELNTAEVIPSIAETPYPDYKLTNLKMNVIPGMSCTLSFECKRFGRNVNFNGSAY